MSQDQDTKNNKKIINTTLQAPKQRRRKLAATWGLDLFLVVMMSVSMAMFIGQ